MQASSEPVLNVLNNAAQAGYKVALVMGIDEAGELSVMNAGLSPLQIVWIFEEFKMKLIMGTPSMPLPPPPSPSS
jgi:hypothetical protein